MSEKPDSYIIPPVPEVDQYDHGGDELPSYEDLAVQNGPNSRYGCQAHMWLPYSRSKLSFIGSVVGRDG